MKLGFIARADNSGLGTMSWEFSRHLPFEKILVVKNGVYAIFTERFPRARVVHKDRIEKEDIDWLLDGITHLLAIETPYDYEIFRLARQKCIRTVLIPMYECMGETLPVNPDLFLCPSTLDFKLMPRPKKYLPVPVDRSRLPFRQRRHAKVFLHSVGHGGIMGRNGTSELLAAIPMVKSDVKFIIRSQKAFDYSHPKVELRVGNFENYWDLWSEGDVFVFPHKFDGLSLPIQEALSVGMPVLSTAMFPFLGWMPEHWFIPAIEIVQAKPALRMIDYALVEPEQIAKKIDEFANTDITEASRTADELAKALDWKVLKERYLQVIAKA